MSRNVISISGLGKSFRRYSHPGWKALGAFGVPVPQRSYDEFWALREVNLSIAAGERIALVGKNGAGKSTLLRLITGQMEASAGTVEVGGRIQALMELGTGFHPDFTGVENIRSALLYNGVAGQDLEDRCQEVIEFTELEDFIDRPVKEFSSGMYARLAFAVATSIHPEILIIDEILGVGDAYFTGKCIQRMQALTARGATVLFVSHDMSAVQLLCDRAVWLESGKVRMDGDTLSVSKAYLAEIRYQEDLRLRARAMAISKRALRSVQDQTEGTQPMLFRFVARRPVEPKNPIYVSAISFGLGEHTLGEIDVVAGAPSGDRLILEKKYMDWGDPTNVKGRAARPFASYGGRYAHAPWVINYPAYASGQRWLQVEYLAALDCDVHVELYEESVKAYRDLGPLPGVTGDRWMQVKFVFDGTAALQAQQPEAPAVEALGLGEHDRYGDGDLRITAFGFVDQNGQGTHVLTSGAAAEAIIVCETNRIITEPVAVVAIYRPDGVCVMQIISTLAGLYIPAVSGQGVIRARFERLNLGPGEYIASVALFKHLNPASRQEPPAYDLHDRCYPLKVTAADGIAVEIGIVNQVAKWSVDFG